MGNLTFWRVIFVALFAFVTWATLTPNPEDTEGGFKIAEWLATLLFSNAQFADKIAHFLAYSALGFVGFHAKILPANWQYLSLLLLPAYGALLEALQGVGAVREPSVLDAFANASGAFAGICFAAITSALRKSLS